MKAIEGVLTAMATPFDEQGGVDADAGRRLAAHLLEHGSHGLVIGGTTGECPTLTDEETIELLRAVRTEVGDEVLLICGTGTNDTRHSRELTKAAAAAGADASLVVAPYYNKPNPAGLRAHFEAVAEAVPELPMVVYNIPARVVINMPPDLLAELAAIDNIVAVKQANDEELGPIEGLAILAGNDNTFLRVLEFGGAGGITRRLARRRRADARDVGRGPERGHFPRPRDRRRADASLRGPLGDHQPDSGQGRARHARPDPGADAAAAGSGGRRPAGRGQDRAGGHRPSGRPIANF